MAVDKGKLTQNAQRLVQRGQLDKAIKEYLKVVEADPNDVRTLLKVGDLYTKVGDTAAATATYMKVAEFYSGQGFYLKAVAVYKQILKVESEQVVVNLKLAELYQQLGLAGDALSQYQVVAASYERGGQTEDALEILRRMNQLDPDNIPSRIKLGELYARLGKNDEARQQLEHVAAVLKKQGRVDDYMRVAERLSHLKPDDIELVRQLAHYYVQQNDAKRALAKLQICFKHDPRDVTTLTLLAEAFRDLKQFSKTVAVYKELIKLYRQRGEDQRARECYEKVLILAPDDGEASALLTAPLEPAAAAPPPLPARAAPPPPTPAASEAPHGAAIGRIKTTQRRVEAPPAIHERVREVAPAAPTQPDQAVAPLGPEAGSLVEKLLTETEVFLRYGLKAKARENLERIVKHQPDYVPAWEKLRELCLSMNDPGGAAQAAEHLTALLADQGAPLARVGAASAQPAEPADADAMLADPFEEELEVDVHLADGGELEDEPGASHEESDERAAAPLVLSGESRLRSQEVALEVDDEVRELAQQIEPGQAVVSGETEFGVEPGGTEELLEAGGDEATTLETDLEEIEFFLEQGMLDEAQGALEELEGRLRDDRELMAALQPIRERLIELRDNAIAALDGDPASAGLAALDTEPTAAASTQELSSADMAMSDLTSDQVPGDDLASELAPGDDLTSDQVPGDDAASDQVPGDDLVSDLASDLAAMVSSYGGEQADASPMDPDVSVEEVLAEFKRGIEATVDDEDFSTHFDLGIAYREMGLIDEALFEFKKSARAPDKEVDSHQMIGLCHVERGEHAPAIEHFKAALNSDRVTAKQLVGLRYELGNAYELAGDQANACKAYEKVFRTDPSFRDIKQRFERTRAAAGELATAPATSPTLVQASGEAQFDPSALLADEEAEAAPVTPAARPARSTVHASAGARTASASGEVSFDPPAPKPEDGTPARSRPGEDTPAGAAAPPSSRPAANKPAVTTAPAASRSAAGKQAPPADRDAALKALLGELDDLGIGGGASTSGGHEASSTDAGEHGPTKGKGKVSYL